MRPARSALRFGRVSGRLRHTLSARAQNSVLERAVRYGVGQTAASPGMAPIARAAQVRRDSQGLMAITTWSARTNDSDNNTRKLRSRDQPLLPQGVSTKAPRIAPSALPQPLARVMARPSSRLALSRQSPPIRERVAEGSVLQGARWIDPSEEPSVPTMEIVSSASMTVVGRRVRSQVEPISGSPLMSPSSVWTQRQFAPSDGESNPYPNTSGFDWNSRDGGPFTSRWPSAVQTVGLPSPGTAPDPVDSTNGERATVGAIHLDGNALGQWITRHLERTLSQPNRGPSGVDPRVIPTWGPLSASY